ncbi:hypothetical protein BURPS1710A_A1547 [Burkholderia pseudomallei 1710a]|uniref:Uncharacterized protein n=1 Tax=Burkholderia pseudomallei 1710a TaxID=320371 RepID=A0A0E1W3X1_BURPE|nr:hypothetical protein BURPS1710A_A1547 [Burkholderia pseudomallei 1710a]
MPSQPDAYADGWLFSLRDAVHRCEPGVNRGRRRSGGRRTGELANWRTGGSADRRTGDIGSDIASARPALALTRVKR